MFEDVKAIFRNDPAAKNIEFLVYPSLRAIVVHRYINHPLYSFGVPFFPRLISEFMKLISGIEIHPGANIGRGFFADHGYGIVIGETAEIGKNLVLFHNVTIGGTGKHTGKRHPTIGDNVLIGTSATLLGPIKIGNNVKIGAETFIINHDVPDNCTVVGVPGKIVRLNDKRVDIALKPSKLHN